MKLPVATPVTIVKRCPIGRQDLRTIKGVARGRSRFMPGQERGSLILLSIGYMISRGLAKAGSRRR